MHSQLPKLINLVFVSCCCCNWMPQTLWPQTARVYHLTGLEILNPKIGLTGVQSSYQKAELFVQAVRWGKICFLFFYGFESLPAFLGLQFPYSIFRGWKISLELHILPSLLDLYCSLFPFLWTLAITLGCPGGASGLKQTNKQTKTLLQCRRWGYMGSIPGLGRFAGEDNGCPLQYSCLENPMDRGA